jgi:putative transposase
MKEIYNAEDIDKAQLAIKAFEIDYGAKYPRAVAKIVDDAEVLLEFYRYPAEHWIHLRTTNRIESTFSLFHSTFEDQSHQRAGLPRGRAGDGVQAYRRRAGLPNPTSKNHTTTPYTTPLDLTHAQSVGQPIHNY